MRKPGCIEPVIYFTNRDGYHRLACYTGEPTPEGWMRHDDADTLPAARKLQDTLVAQSRREWEAEEQYDRAQVQRFEDAMRDKFNEAIASSATSEYEKDFLRNWMKLRDVRKREKYLKIYHQRQAYLYSLEYDSPGRAVDKEVFNVEKHTVTG